MSKGKIAHLVMGSISRSSPRKILYLSLGGSSLCLAGMFVKSLGTQNLIGIKPRFTRLEAVPRDIFLRERNCYFDNYAIFGMKIKLQDYFGSVVVATYTITIMNKVKLEAWYF